ncbi:phosphonopyruvate decarboxylase-like protein [Strigomonas culicis]|uniref:Phosphonopyruvate decarboxylase-like protein n=1 Tax=Strigomonas culicis TaxID=28005 RepID=S9VS10_9TRYP|nr:phosphonopyruvate decarboxylase-like protein [Strigomonas culicis]|eukprot:EPY26020.1 phosphonopyruvate decarboxylase-like protein [Strigomonas culicis]
MLRRALLLRCAAEPLPMPPLQKLHPSRMCETLRRRGVETFFGVPNPLLRPLSTYLRATGTDPAAHVIAANEATAMAMAAGYHLATGAVPCVYVENSGLGMVASPILSLLHRELYAVPCLVLVGWRGTPHAEVPDGPAQTVQGKLTEGMLSALEVPFSVLCGSDNMDFYWDVLLDKAFFHFQSHGTPFVVLVEQDALAMDEAAAAALPPEDAALQVELPLSLEAAVEQVTRQLDARDVVVTSPGGISDALYAVRERLGQRHAQDLTLVGGSGLAGSVAAGVALAQPTRDVVVLEGDGAVLAQLGAVAVAGGAAAVRDARTGTGCLLHNYKHIVLNNGAAGDQPTCAMDVSLSAIAKGCGYALAREEPVLQLGDLVAAVRDLKAMAGPAFLEVCVRRSDAAAETTCPVVPSKMKENFTRFLHEGVRPPADAA